MGSRKLSLLLVFWFCPQTALLSKANVDLSTPCVPNPCLNTGVCSVNGTSFACQCPQGFQGSKCEILPGQCITNPCINGICQLDSTGNTKCFCTPGYAGRFCEINEDECASSPCRNGGLCFDRVNSYKCECKPGTYGLHCELLEKDLQKCVRGCDGGVCWRNESRVISVEWGYGKFLCNTQHSCFGLPNGTLAVTPDDGYIDVQLRPQQIQLGDSLNFTMDVDMAAYVKIRPYYSSREEFFSCNQTSGTYLTSGPVSSLLLGPELLKEGRMIFIDNVDTIFRCEFGLRLNVSVKVNKCENTGSADLCSDHGQCLTSFGMSAYQCKCCGGFRGEFCEKDDHCFSKPCKNGAKCHNKEGDPNELYTCTCAPGYEGRHCSKVIDMCASKPCKRDATCTPLVNDFNCACPRGYTGKICDAELDACSSSPCENGATCVNKLDTFICLCTPGYTGSHCEVNINECASSPCQHGTCIDHINGYKCYCKPGFGGTNCGLNLNECLSNPCYNGGFCVDEENNYRCACGHGFRGKHCEVDLDLCKEDGWCVNAISCVDKGNHVDCQCKPGYTGANCGVDIHDCVHQPCQNGGTCRDLVNDFKCLCNKGFTGKTCEISSEQPKPTPDTRTLPLQILTEDCHLLKNSVLAKDILKNITYHMASSCNCAFTAHHLHHESMSIQCTDSINARLTVKISGVAKISSAQLECLLWQNLKNHSNVLDLGHDTFLVGMENDMASKCKRFGYHDNKKIGVAAKTKESSTNLAITIGSVCVVAGLVVAAIVVCCRCRNSRPPTLKKHQARVEDDRINRLSGELIDAVAPTPKSMYRTSGGYHNYAFSGRFDPENPIKSKRV